MRRLHYLIFIASLLLLLSACTVATETDNQASNEQPIRFADGVITTNDTTERSLTFSPDGTEVYFHRRDHNFPIVYKSQYMKGTWSSPIIAEFAPDRFHNESAFISPDGQSLFFASNRPGDREDNLLPQYRIWIMHLIEGQWSNPENPLPLNGDYEDAYPSVSKDGTLIFTSNRSGGIGGFDLYQSEFVDGQYTTPINLGSTMNTVGDDYPSYIDQDGNFIILCRGTEMLISYHHTNTWSQPEKLYLQANPSEPLVGRAPYISPDQKMFYYENSGDFYQIDLDQLNIKR